MILSRHIIFILFLSILASGCSSVVKTNTQLLNQQSLPLIHWQLDARMAFKSPEESFSATLYWQFNDTQSSLRLSKLLGGTLFTLDIDPMGATLMLDGETYRDDDAQRMLYQLTGWLVPIKQLHLWVQGLTGPLSAYREIKRNQDGALSKLHSVDGWQVSYGSYQPVGTLTLPKSLTIKRNDLRIKLRINDWQI